MVKITVCIGSSCHLKGSRQIVEQLQRLVKLNKLDSDVDLSGTFCMGQCADGGVAVAVNGEYHSVRPETAGDFFDGVVVKSLNAAM
ncbi:MAG: (2Fe-2S) ferredoxin domain-containing protein [Clostridiales bacterium]|jgi:NADH:ubiquinone oxidoreductase subunit E|nr:(2Fe-2S) ferredoxin domain-containing protein [Clostridiales bacterium]